MSEMIDFHIELSPNFHGGYVARVLNAPRMGPGWTTFNIDVDGIVNRRDDLENAVIASSAVARRAIPLAERPLLEVGTQLFRAVFAGPVNNSYHASLGSLDDGQRLRLVLSVTAPELAAIPWETLFDPDRSAYVCLQTPLVRNIPAPGFVPTPLDIAPPLRILCVVSAPRNLPLMDADIEIEHLKRALADGIAERRVEIDFVRQATWRSLHARLLSGPWHVVHFIGHGDFDPGKGEGCVALVADDGRSDMVEASRFIELLDEADPTPRLVVLNSCASGRAAADDMFAGTAAALARGGINAVAAMQFTVTDSAAVRFAEGFYTALSEGRAVDRALLSARKAILGLPGTLEWVTPVLYLRGGATQLFRLPSVAAPHADTGRRTRPGPRPAPIPEVVPEPSPPPTEAIGRRHVIGARPVQAPAKARLVQSVAPALALCLAAAGLALLAAVLLVVHPFQPISDKRDTETLWGGDRYKVVPPLIAAGVVGLAGVLIATSRRTRPVGLAVLAGGAIVTPGLLFMQWMSKGVNYPDFWSDWRAGTVLWLVGISLCLVAGCVAWFALFQTRATWLRPQLSFADRRTQLAVLVGSAASLGLLLHYVAPPDEPSNQASGPLAAFCIIATALVVPLAISTIRDRRVRIGLVSGWAAMCAVFFYLRLDKIDVSAIAIALVGVFALFVVGCVVWAARAWRDDVVLRFPPNRRGIDNEEHDAREAEEVRPGVS